MKLEEARKLYHGLDSKTFLDAACCSIIPENTKKALQDFIDMTVECPQASSSAYHVAMDQCRVFPVEQAAKLLNADMEEIALVESTSYGLNVAATSLPLPPGSKILTSDLEFLQVTIPWCMQKERGITVELVPSRNGRIEVEDYEKAIDENTRMILLSSVAWCNGWRIDLAAFSKLCQKRSIYFVVDAVHHVGICDFNTKAYHVDIMTTGGHKWLNSPYGCGILYVNKKLLPKINPVFWGYLALEEPEGGWPAYFGDPTVTPLRDWKFQSSAKRFEVAGTSNYLGAVALGQSLKLVNDIGIQNIQAHAVKLTDCLMDELEKIGATLITHRDPEHRSGIVVFRFYNTLAEENKLLDYLHIHKVYVAMRFTSGIGGIRVSCHYFNTRSDVDHLITVLKQARKKKAPDYKR